MGMLYRKMRVFIIIFIYSKIVKTSRMIFSPTNASISTLMFVIENLSEWEHLNFMLENLLSQRYVLASIGSNISLKFSKLWYLCSSSNLKKFNLALVLP